MSELDVPSATYPVAFDVDPDTTGRNRLTCFFRLLLAIPHNLFVGSPGGGPLPLPDTTRFRRRWCGVAARRSMAPLMIRDHRTP